MTNNLCTATTNIVSRNISFLFVTKSTTVAQLSSFCCWSWPLFQWNSCVTETSVVKTALKDVWRLTREHHCHLEVAAGQDSHPLLPLQDMDNAARPAHLRCQRGRDRRLAGPPSLGWVAYGNSRGHLDLMAWSRSWPGNKQPDSPSFFFVVSVMHVFVVVIRQ